MAPSLLPRRQLAHAGLDGGLGDAPVAQQQRGRRAAHAMLRQPGERHPARPRRGSTVARPSPPGSSHDEVQAGGDAGGPPVGQVPAERRDQRVAARRGR